MSELRSLLIDAAAEAEDDDVAVLLSGGVDSLSCAFAAEEAGKDVYAYTFRMKGIPNADARAAREAAKAFDWPFALVDVPRDTETIRRNFLRLADEWDCKRKTDFECSYPMLYLIPEVEQSTVLCGIGADGLYGMGREAAFNYRDDCAAFDEYRSNYRAGAERQIRSMIKAKDRTPVLPYRKDCVINYFLEYGWYELNEPREKYHTLAAFRDKFKQFGVREHGPFQLIARIPHYFENLLETDLNQKNRERVMDLCHDFGKFNNLDPKRWLNNKTP